MHKNRVHKLGKTRGSPKLKKLSKKVLTFLHSFGIIVERFESRGRNEPARSELLEKLFEKNEKSFKKGIDKSRKLW